MNLVTKLGVVTLAAVTIAPLATSAINPVDAQAKTVKKAKKVAKKKVTKKSVKKAKKVSKKKVKIYKINKNLLRSKKTYLMLPSRMGKNYDWHMGITISQLSAKRLYIITENNMETNALKYKITSQKTKGNTMTFKLKTILTKEDKAGHTGRGNGTIKIIRTGKNSYKIPTIYRGGKLAWRINNHKIAMFQSDFIKPTKTSISGLKMMPAKKAGHFVKQEFKYVK